MGDTITDAARPCDQALPGYKKVNPMVYCGMYPADGAKYPDLREALEKLQLNDASLSLSRKLPSLWDLASDAASSACCILKLSRNGLSVNIIWIW